MKNEQNNSTVVRKTFAKLVTQCRKDAEFSKTALSVACETSLTYIIKIEKGERIPNYDFCLKLLNIFTPKLSLDEDDRKFFLKLAYDGRRERKKKPKNKSDPGFFKAISPSGDGVKTFTRLLTKYIEKSIYGDDDIKILSTVLDEDPEYIFNIVHGQCLPPPLDLCKKICEELGLTEPETKRLIELNIKERISEEEMNFIDKHKRESAAAQWFGELIQTARKKAGLTISELAKKLNMPPDSLKKIEEEDCGPESIEEYNEFVEILNLDSNVTDKFLLNEYIRISFYKDMESFLQIEYLTKKAKLIVQNRLAESAGVDEAIKVLKNPDILKALQNPTAIKALLYADKNKNMATSEIMQNFLQGPHTDTPKAVKDILGNPEILEALQDSDIINALTNPRTRQIIKLLHKPTKEELTKSSELTPDAKEWPQHHDLIYKEYLTMRESGQATIVIIDPDDKTVESYAPALKGGASIHIPTNEALDFLKKEYIDSDTVVVLLEIRLPEIDGIEVLKEIKEINKDIPVIITTAHGSKDVVIQALKYGADGFMEKPIKADELKEEIQQLLKRDDRTARKEPLKKTHAKKRFQITHSSKPSQNSPPKKGKRS